MEPLSYYCHDLSRPKGIKRIKGIIKLLTTGYYIKTKLERQSGRNVQILSMSKSIKSINLGLGQYFFENSSISLQFYDKIHKNQENVSMFCIFFVLHTL